MISAKKNLVEEINVVWMVKGSFSEVIIELTSKERISSIIYFNGMILSYSIYSPISSVSISSLSLMPLYFLSF